MADQMAKDQAREEMTRISARIRQNKPATPEAFAALANDKVSSNDTQWFQKTEPLPGIGHNPALTTWAFTAKQNDIGDMVGTQRGIVIPFLYGIRPAGVTALTEIRSRVESDARMEKARQAARESLAKAAAGAASVDAIASKLSLVASDTTINRQGFIGGFTGDTSALVSAALAADPGQLKGPIVVSDGAVYFQVTEMKKVTPQELKENTAAYINALRGQQARSLRKVLLEKLRKEAKVDINEKVLERGTAQGA
jgi:parvulin-like peptidyl-prolyl isomerase